MAGLVCWLVAATGAGQVPTAPADAGDASTPTERVTVRVDGRAVFRVGANDVEDARTRAAQVERRINALRDNPDAIAPVLVEAGGAQGQTRVLSVAGVPVVTVFPEDAQDNVTTVDALAAQWQAALDRALQRSKQTRQTGWGRFRAEVQGSVEAAFSRLGESAVTVIPRALAALLVLVLFYAIATTLRWTLRLVFRQFISDLTLENLIMQVAYYAVWLLGIVLAVDALGWDPQATATGLGLTGLALGFALRDVLSNLVSGVLLLASRPFEVGDQIVVGATEGSVVKILLRATQIRTYDGRIVLVPNAELFTGRITNNTANPVRRGAVTFHLGYDQDLQRAAEVMRSAAAGAEGVLADPPASVRVIDLGPDAIELEARFWTDSRRFDHVATTSAVRSGILQAMKRAGIGLPEPNLRVLASPREPGAASGVALNAGDDGPSPAAGPP